MKTKTILIAMMMLLVNSLFAQEKTEADQYFDRGDYIAAANAYENELKIEHHKKTIEKIATCYYNTFQYEMAALYMKKIVTGRFVEHDKTYDNLFNFRLHQMLSALGDYETGLDYYKLYKENIDKPFDKSKAIETIEKFRLKNPDFTINEVTFNSLQSDFGATKFNDSVYFVSDRPSHKIHAKKYKWTHQEYLDFYAVKINDKIDTLSSVISLKDLNSDLHEGCVSFSRDGNTLYMCRSNQKNGEPIFDKTNNNNTGIYIFKKINGKWKNAERLPFCNTEYSYKNPSLSPDEKKLYFSTDAPGGFGQFDIYYVDISEDGLYGSPINLGDKINTSTREVFPFISKEGHLFFSSNGHLGLGMLDVFVSKNVDNEFTTPQNLGAPINSRYDDFSFNYYNNTEGFFASNRNNVNDNIYKFTQKGDVFIQEYINIFEIKDAQTQEYITNAQVVLTDATGKEIYHNTLYKSANFNVNLPVGEYKFKAENDVYIPNQINLKVINQENQKQIIYLKKKEIVNTPVKEKTTENVIVDLNSKEKIEKRAEMIADAVGPPVIEKEGKLFFKLEPIYFDYNMWEITAESRKILDDLADKLERYPDIHLKISAYTDTRGTDRYNQILSEKRAESTRNYLALEDYINARRLHFEGFGESHPKVDCKDNCTEIEHHLNRRSEFEIVKY